MSPAARPIADRFWEKVDKSGECWIWTARVAPNGYGHFAVSHARPTAAHRVAYELTVGPIPAGLVLDHLCRNTRCVRPDHLEPVTQAENMRRGLKGQQTHCKRGHSLTDPANLYPVALRRGHRRCRACAVGKLWLKERAS